MTIFKPDEGRTDEFGNKEFIIKTTGGPTKHNRYQKRRNPFFSEAKSPEKPKIASEAYAELIIGLRLARSSRRITQSELAKTLGSSQAAISRFEKGYTSPSLKFLLSYAAAVGEKVAFTLK